MVVVMAIIVMVAGFMTPAIQQLIEYRKIEGSARVVINTINSARQEAISKRTDIGVVFYRDSVAIYNIEGISESEGSDKIHFPEGRKRYQKHALLVYDLPFANLTYDEIPEFPQGQKDTDTIRPTDVMLTLKSDGSIAFVKNKDVGTHLYVEKKSADIVVRVTSKQEGNDAIFIDIRAAGLVAFEHLLIDDDHEFMEAGQQ